MSSNSLFSNYTLTLTTLSPVHIGAGNEKSWFKWMDFVTHKGNIYLLNQEKLFDELDGIGKLDQYTEWIAGGNFIKLQELFDKYIDPSDVAVHSFALKETDVARDIRTVVRMGGEASPAIPGSSLKGAIRSAMFNRLATPGALPKGPVGIHQKGAVNGHQKEILGDMETALTRFLRPSDILFNNGDTEIGNVQLFNLSGTLNVDNWKGSWKQHFSLSMEFIPEGKKAAFRFSVADGLWETIRRYLTSLPQKGNLVFQKGNSLQKLFKIINQHTIEHLRREIHFFSTYKNDCDDIIEEMERLKDIAEKALQHNTGCVLRMGAGAGFHGITGDWQFADHTKTGFHSAGKHGGKKFAKSRKILADALMGFVWLAPEGVTSSQEVHPAPIGEQSPESGGPPPHPINKPKPKDFAEMDPQQIVDKQTQIWAEVINGAKNVRLFLVGSQPEVQLVLSKFQKASPPADGDYVKVVVKQRKSSGEITQVAIP